MKLFILFSILFLSFSILQLQAGMEATDKCKKIINVLEADISTLSNQLRQICDDEKQLVEERNNLLKAKEDFNNAKLIPRIIKEKKIRKVQEQIDVICNEKLPDILRNKHRNEQEHLIKNTALVNEKNRLSSYRVITIRKIHIRAYGKWDSVFYAPEIVVNLGDKTIAEGRKDDFALYAEINENVKDHQHLDVNDRDVTKLQFMGRIPLELNILPTGIYGDFFIQTISGKIHKADGLGFEYKVEYGVEY